MNKVNVLPHFVRYFERRMAEPVWRPFFYLRELSQRLTTRISNRKRIDVDLTNRFCQAPFRQFEVLETGRVHLCCSSWLPDSIGDLNAEDATAIWNSDKAQKIRRTILEGTYDYCNKNVCPEIVQGTLPTKKEVRADPFFREIIDRGKTILDEPATYVVMSHDRSCNLSCPSCRISRVNFAKGRTYELRQSLQKKLESAFFEEPTDRAFTVKVTGSGDPFASRVFRDFLYSLDGEEFPNLSIVLQSNGTLFNEKAWSRLHKIHSNISSVMISFDAATEETYAITRRDGSWRHLIKNAEFLARLRQQNKIGNLFLEFVVQQANFHEMLKFIDIGKRLNADVISFSKMVNWGTRTQAEHQSLCVWLPEHPQHNEFRKLLTQPGFDDPTVWLGNLEVERQIACARLSSG